jgi:hypothetical protein
MRRALDRLPRVRTMSTAIFGCAIVLGCAVPALDLEGRECPCGGSGWRCDTTRNVCVRDELVLDAGRRDAFVRADSGRARDAGSDAGEDDDAGEMRDGGADPSACDDVHAGAIFCDGFESGDTFPEWDGLSTEGGGVPGLSTGERYRGGGAFDARTSGGSQRAYISREGFGAVATGELDLRAYLFLRSTPATDHISTIFLFDEAANGVALEVYAGGNAAIYLSETDESFPISPPIPRDRWVCVELHVTIAASGTVAFSWDGEERERVADIDTRPDGSYTDFSVGILNSASSNTEGSALLFDEVVLDDAPIGCDP